MQINPPYCLFKTTTTSRAVGVWIDVFHCFRKWACSLLEVVIVEEKLQYYLKGYKKVKIFLSGPDYKLKLQYNISLWISLCSVYSTVWKYACRKDGAISCCTGVLTKHIGLVIPGFCSCRSLNPNS